MIVLVCGSRNWTQVEPIEKELKAIRKKYGKDTLVITGGCKGADSIAHGIAQKLGMQTRVFLAEWSRFGKSAGPIRNQRMLDEGNPQLVLAFYDDPGFLAPSSRSGTKDMVERARKAEVQVRIFGEN